MDSRYIITWTSKVNGKRGSGTKQFDQAEAERLAEELNHEYPEIDHEAMLVAGDLAQGVPQPLPA